MTLTALASLITTKLNDTDAASVAICKEFINRRYQMIWDGAIWTETLGVVESTVSAEQPSVILDQLPSIFYSQQYGDTTQAFMDFPVAVRFTPTGQDDGFELPGNDWMSFFQLDPNIWNDVSSRRATPTNFINLPKTAFGYAAIKFAPVPDVAGTAYVLGKLNFTPLQDLYSPCLRGADNALLAFAEGDMLERARQYGKAQAKYAEAAAQVQIMKDIEKGQRQNTSMIVPMEEGYYSPCSPE